ncbi:hypothetical protein Pla52n_36300 [Stieleria varia]|uniref:Uncharacterized protein n=1 Tax=Stieleria varia TaxID=2528005 RepID=A0A5C6ASB4_9BACT|nr:hypothetical protein Pla52n_36300 [Stieleria varia]
MTVTERETAIVGHAVHDIIRLTSHHGVHSATPFGVGLNSTASTGGVRYARPPATIWDHFMVRCHLPKGTWGRTRLAV